MATAFEKLVDSTPYLWKGEHPGRTSSDHLSTGFEALDKALPVGGWPLGSVVELLPASIGIGELRLLLPILRALTQKQLNVLMINAPHHPYAPALVRAGIDLNYLLIITNTTQRDALWSAEKALRNRACGMVLLWCDDRHRPGSIKEPIIRRLQVAAQTGTSILILYRFCSPNNSRNLLSRSSWATIRLKLEASGDDELKIKILRAPGAYKPRCLRIRLVQTKL